MHELNQEINLLSKSLYKGQVDQNFAFQHKLANSFLKIHKNGQKGIDYKAA
jgi:hypothetical protein